MQYQKTLILLKESSQKFVTSFREDDYKVTQRPELMIHVLDRYISSFSLFKYIYFLFHIRNLLCSSYSCKFQCKDPPLEVHTLHFNPGQHILHKKAPCADLLLRFPLSQFSELSCVPLLYHTQTYYRNLQVLFKAVHKLSYQIHNQPSLEPPEGLFCAPHQVSNPEAPDEVNMIIA